MHITATNAVSYLRPMSKRFVGKNKKSEAVLLLAGEHLGPLGCMQSGSEVSHSAMLNINDSTHIKMSLFH